MLSKILKQERTKKGLSQMAFAKLFGVSQQTIGSWETNRTSPDLESLSKLANFFNVSIDYLLGLTNIPETIDTYIAKQNNKPAIESQYNADEQNLIKKYRQLKAEDKQIIDTMLERFVPTKEPKSDEKAI